MYNAFRKVLLFFFHFLRFKQTPPTQLPLTVDTLNKFSDPELQKNGNGKLRKKIGDLICKFQSFYVYKKSCIINNLPDEILTHILSFLSMKEAFRTSVLSKRWIPLCNSISVLHFDDGRLLYPRNTEKRAHFCQFVDKIMFNPHSQHVTLKSLQIMFYSGLRTDEAGCDIFDKWVEAAKQRHIEDLYLYMFNVHLAPSTIFCCKTLVVLRLMYIHIAKMFHCSVDLPLLKTLQLFDIYFEVEEDYMKLLSGCPKLENWENTIVYREDGHRVMGYIEPLPKLINAEIILFRVPYTPLKNVKFLKVSQFGQDLNDEMNSYYKNFPVFENLTKLQLFWCLNILLDWGEVLKMLPSCPKLQSLEIKKERSSICMEDWKYPYDVPECVSSNLTTCKIIDYQAIEADFRFAAYILENARLLQVMTIRTFKPKPTGIPQYLEGLSSCSRSSPICKLSVSKM